jgi:hypothetical protein
LTILVAKRFDVDGFPFVLEILIAYPWSNDSLINLFVNEYKAHINTYIWVDFYGG